MAGWKKLPEIGGKGLAGVGGTGLEEPVGLGLWGPLEKNHQSDQSKGSGCVRRLRTEEDKHVAKE